jgi:hypothetical protein
MKLDFFENLIKETLTKEIYTKDELMAIFHLNSLEFEEKFLTPNTKQCKQFKLRQRTLHVVSGKQFIYCCLSYFHTNVEFFHTFHNM